MSGALVATHQVNSVPAHIARQAGVTDFQQPTVSEPGIPVELALQSLSPAPIIAPKAGAPGAPTNLRAPALLQQHGRAGRHPDRRHQPRRPTTAACTT